MIPVFVDALVPDRRSSEVGRVAALVLLVAALAACGADGDAAPTGSDALGGAGRTESVQAAAGSGASAGVNGAAGMSAAAAGSGAGADLAAAGSGAVGGQPAAPGAQAGGPASGNAGAGGLGAAGAGIAGASPGAAGAGAAAGSGALPPPPFPAELQWSRCGAFECAKLAVPLDYADPNGETIELALERQPARGQRLGSLLINPGGPGASAIDFLSDFVSSIAGPALLDRFDIVAFDPRGVGASTPLSCHSSLQQWIATDPTPDSDAEWDALDRASAALADECGQKYAKLLPHMSTPTVARDMDQVRAALREDKLHYLGFSYGTELGAWYAQLFPQHVGALVLDGAVDLQLAALDMLLQQAKGFELALATYFDWCGQAVANCTWAGRSTPAQAFAQLAASVDATPLPSPRGDRPLGTGEFTLGVIMPLYGGEQGYRLLSQGLAAAASGDGSTLLSYADTYLERHSDGSYGNIFEANNAVNCLDMPVPDYATIRGRADEFVATSPNFGLSTLTASLVCVHWPAQPPAQRPPPPTATGAAPILVIGTTGDPATPYAWAQSLASELQSGVLLTYEGEGHTAYGRGVACIDDAVDAYLVRGELPAEGTRCGDTGAPASMLRLPPPRFR